MTDNDNPRKPFHGEDTKSWDDKCLEILNKRAATYGDATTMYSAVERIRDTLIMVHCKQTDENIPGGFMGLMNQVAVKLVRIMANPEHNDSYVDAINYLRLARESHLAFTARSKARSEGDKKNESIATDIKG